MTKNYAFKEDNQNRTKHDTILTINKSKT